MNEARSQTIKGKDTGMRKKSTVNRWFIILMLLIPILNHWVFFLYPNINSIFLAFMRKSSAAAEAGWSLDNFRMIFNKLFVEKSEIYEGLVNTLIFFLFSNVFMFCLSYIWTYFFYKRIRGRAFFRVVFYVVSIIGMSITCSIFKYMLKSNGLIGVLYTKLFNTDSAPLFLSQNEYAMKTILFFVFWSGFGGSYIIFGGTFSKIPDDVVEYGLIDGVNTMWKEIRYIIFPLTWPTFSTLFSINLSQILVASGPILLLTKGAAGTYTLSYWIFEQLAYGGFNKYYEASALGILMTAVTLPIFLISRYFMRKIEAVEY